MNPDEYCQQLLRQSGSSFALSFVFLEPQKRQAITALYAFCRQVDDIADHCREIAVAETQLNWWDAEVERLFQGQASHPIGLALQQALQHFPLQQSLFHDIITGVRQDLQQSRIMDRPALQQYCYYVAGAVGLLSTQIFGYEDDQVLEYARTLGQALQMTNILRDLREDGQRGRIYLPLEELRRFGVSESDLLNGVSSEAMARLLEYELELTAALYQDAYARLPVDEIPRQMAGLIMAAIYAELLKRIRRKPLRVLQQRVRISALHKLWLAWRTARRANRKRL